MEIKQSNQNFGVKFFRSNLLDATIEASKTKGDFYKINHARKRMELFNPDIRLKLDFKSDGRNKFLEISRYQLKKGDEFTGKTVEDFELTGKGQTRIPNNQKATNFTKKFIENIGRTAPVNEQYQNIIKGTAFDINI